MRYAKENESKNGGAVVDDSGGSIVRGSLSSLLSAQLIGEIVPRLQHKVAIRRSLLPNSVS